MDVFPNLVISLRATVYSKQVDGSIVAELETEFSYVAVELV